MFKCGFVSVLGRPNVGKSTLINSFMGMTLSIVSNKPQTTRKNARMMLTTDDYQMIFIDTPGLHDPKSKLAEQMVSRAKASVKEVDVIVLMVDARETAFHESDIEILEVVRKKKIPVILVVNKVDMVTKEKLLPFISKAASAYSFAAIVPVSAIQGEGPKLILPEILALLPQGEALYPEEVITDQTERQIAAETIREKALKMLDKEIPHGIEVEIERFKYMEKKELYEVYATIYCEKESHKKIVIGKNGEVLKRIGSSARIDIEKMLDAKVYLNLWVKVKTDWRNDAAMLRRMGYFE